MMAHPDLDELRAVTSEQLATIHRTWSLGVIPPTNTDLGKAAEVVLSRAGGATLPGVYRWDDRSEAWERLEQETGGLCQKT
jgi:hypothetical protein